MFKKRKSIMQEEKILPVKVKQKHGKIKTAIIALSVFTAYLLGSFIFEPDFGSFVRHEAATFPVLHLMVLDKCNIIKATNNKEVAEVE